jgi:hypothetical protein
MFTLFAGITLVKDAQQYFQLIAMSFTQPPHLDDITVMGKTFYEFLFLGQFLLGGMVVVFSFYVDNRTVIILEVMPENIDAYNGQCLLSLRLLIQIDIGFFLILLTQILTKPGYISGEFGLL